MSYQITDFPKVEQASVGVGTERPSFFFYLFPTHLGLFIWQATNRSIKSLRFAFKR